MRPWWQEQTFWRDLGPFLFPPESLENGDAEAADLLEWLDLEDDADLSSKRILDAGAGVGRLAIPLARRGLQVVAVDSVDDYRRETRRRAEAAGVTVDVRAIDLLEDGVPPIGPFDAIVCAFALIGYHELALADILLVQRFRELLAPGGKLVVLVRHPEASYGRLKHTSPDGGMLIEERRHDRERQLQFTTWTLMRGGRQRVHRSTLRVYNAADLRGLFEFSGFAPLKVLDHKGDHRIVIVGQRLEVAPAEG